MTTRCPRKHQAEMLALAERIAHGEPIRRIYASVTPGGGKSALPGILAETLIPAFADRILWVVPRNSLRDQGEGDFPDWTRWRIRAAGNEADPCRGTRGYVTTYQAIVADPARHLDSLSRGRWILFLDEPHHIAEGRAWDAALSPLVKRATLTIYASGTFARGDGQRIAGIPYGADGLPLFEGPPRAATIRYSRSDALREGSIVPVAFRYLDGRTEWEEDGERRSAASLSGDYAAQALFTALRTEYALELLDETVTDWRKERETYAGARLLVVSPSIALAEQYRDHLHRRRIDSLIATSADDGQAREAIARFKGRALPGTDCLVTVAMAYEGMSVPAVTHIACLTHIRSVPWLEQCFARANRTAPGKTSGTVFGPNDARFREAIQAIEAEQIQALSEQAEDDAPGDSLEAPEGQGSGRQWIQPISSAAIRLEGETRGLFDETEGPSGETIQPDGGLSPSQAEKLLRGEIARHIEIVLADKRAGSKLIYSKIIHRALKDLVGGKAREDCTTEELTRQWAELKRRWPV